LISKTNNASADKKTAVDKNPTVHSGVIPAIEDVKFVMGEEPEADLVPDA
jgi:hypothetical protein